MANIDPELMKEYRRLAKRADQRLVRLEQLAESGDPNYKGVLTYAYKRAAKDAQKWGSTGEKARFNIKPPETSNELRAKIKDIEHFLEAPTSTKQGITNVYQKRAETFNKNFGGKEKKDRPITWQELANYYKSDQAKKQDRRYGSKTIARAVKIKSNYMAGRTQKELNELEEAVKAARDKGQNYKFIPEDKASDKVINKIISEIVAGEPIEKKTPAKRSYMREALEHVIDPQKAIKKDMRRAKRAVKKGVKNAKKKYAKSKKQRQKARAKKRKNKAKKKKR